MVFVLGVVGGLLFVWWCCDCGYELFVFLVLPVGLLLFVWLLCCFLIGLIIVYCELLSGFVNSVGLYDSC